MQTSLYTALLIGLATAAILATHFPSAAAQSTTPTYVLGVSSPLDPLVVDLQNRTSSLTILSGASGLSLLGPGSILFIDGTWLQSAASIDPAILPLVIATVLNGVPTIVARGNAAILQDSTSGLLNIKPQNLPLITDGINVIGTLPDGTRQGSILQVVSGFNYAIKTEFDWAQQQLANTTPPIITPALTPLGKSPSNRPMDTSSNTPVWQFLLKLTTDTGDNFAPVARITSTFTIFRLQNSGSSTYKWFNFFANQTLQPGVRFYSNGDFEENSNSGWRNFSENDTVNVNSGTNMIISHGPTSQNIRHSATVTYSIGVTAGSLGAAVTASQTQSYQLRNTIITDSAQPFQVGWLHSFDPQTTAGERTFKIIPGWTDRVLADQGIDLSSVFTSTFVTLNSDSTINQTRSTGVSFSVAGG